MTASALERRTPTTKGKSAFKKTLISFPVVSFEIKIKANFKSFKCMVLLQCYLNITRSYSYHCKEMLSLINTFVHLKAYWSICLWYSLPHLPGAIPTTCLSVLYSWFSKLFNNRIFSPHLNRQSNRPIHLTGIKTQLITHSGSHISYLFFLPWEAQSDASFLLALQTLTPCSSWALPKDHASFHKL